MDEAIKQIGERLKGLREVLNIPAEEIAELCEISLDHYLKIESGEADPSVYRLSKSLSDTASTSTYYSSVRNLA